MPKPTPTLEQDAHQVAEILQFLQRLKPQPRNAPPEELSRIKRRLSRSHAEAELEDLTAPTIFYPIAVPLYRQKQPMAMGELGKALDVPQSTATRMVDWLVMHDYAERLPDPTDRRVVRVALTKSGRELYQAINEMVGRRMARILRRLTRAERKQLITLLHRVVEIMEEED